ncbi:flagellar motor switch phosphatase FliY [Hydrogenoanaerobacterium sp.]|uniref:flagellar motor switch phosphatase FliY n=1 Tax=Hydrogenoanaerobacterium sp. TaxID=2953763 RepID=UPI00289DE80B|nr:flagellar motor switch phosphatase FliY [Hydrogenoanaerobacterium sp.]
MEIPQTHLSELETDAIGEILNISMGSAATAMSTMLDKKVDITTPKVSVKPLKEIDYTELEPAMIVKITYIEGISGCSVMVFRQRDMQLLLNQLMGNNDLPQPDFEFDELSMSAACEVMNQMMGASATALSTFLGKSINISTPDAYVMDDDHTFKDAIGVENTDEIVAVRFRLSIDEIMDSEFINVMSIDLAKSLVGQFVQPVQPKVEAQPQPAPQPPQPQYPQPPPQAPVQQAPVAAQAMPPQQGQSFYAENPYYAPPQMQNGYPMMGYPQGGYPMYPNNPTMPVNQPPVNVQGIQVPQFSTQAPVSPTGMPGGNMDLIMNVPLGVSVEIGKTKRKVKEILDFTQGTVIELEKQAGAPVDIIVNGQLIARGDVVVLEDNFGVRITEILNTRDILANNEQN